jgi:hypothetical protein
MASIKALRLGISISLLTLIACAVWFVATDQASEVRRRAFEVRDESLAAARAAQNGVSVEEMKRRAVATCWNTKVDPNSNGDAQSPSSGALLDLWQQNAAIALKDADRSSCMTNYIYGDDLMYEPTFDLFRQWSSAVLKIIFISVCAGAAMAVIFKVALSWWGWLRAD